MNIQGFTFEQITEKPKSFLRLMTYGPPGAGKTFSSMYLALLMQKYEREKVDPNAGPIIFIDTESGSGKKYFGENYDGLQWVSPNMIYVHFWKPYTPEKYIEILQQCREYNPFLVIIDSITHLWSGEGGILERHSKAGGQFTHWAKVNPILTKTIETILSSPFHVICNARAKVEHVIESYIDNNGRNRTKIALKGMGAEFRKSINYEFDIILEFLLADDNSGGVCSVIKTRYSQLNGYTSVAGPEIARYLHQWLSEGKVYSPMTTVEFEAELRDRFAGTQLFDENDLIREQPMYQAWSDAGLPIDYQPHLANDYLQVLDNVLFASNTAQQSPPYNPEQ